MIDHFQVLNHSLELDLSELTFLSDRGGEFGQVSVFETHVRTASHNQDPKGESANGITNLLFYVTFHDREPPQVGKMCYVGTLEFGQNTLGSFIAPPVTLSVYSACGSKCF